MNNNKKDENQTSKAKQKLETWDKNTFGRQKVEKTYIWSNEEMILDHLHEQLLGIEPAPLAGRPPASHLWSSNPLLVQQSLLRHFSEIGFENLFWQWINCYWEIYLNLKEILFTFTFQKLKSKNIFNCPGHTKTPKFLWKASKSPFCQVSSTVNCYGI